MQLRGQVKHKIQFPEKVAPIFTPAPFKILFGGRGSSKSWDFARALLLLGSKRPLFIVCAREVQKSIKDSVHKLLADQVVELGFHRHIDEETGEEVPEFYEILDSEIRGANGTTFVFIGLNNIQSVKSMEGIDILWVTEANHVSKAKWNILLPTVRRDPPFGPFQEGSEIWVDFNPELMSDDTYQMFVVSPPEGAIVIEINYYDNPFFPQFLRKQMEEMRAKDPDEYMTVWEGKPRKAMQGAIFVTELTAGILDGRISPHIKYDKTRPVIATFDLGDSDMTAMWVWQQIGNTHLAIDYVEENGKDITYFIEILQQRRYIVKGVWLPHDAKQAHQAARVLTHNTIEKQVRAIYPTGGVVKIVPSISEALQINATRTIFPRVLINDNVCSRGVMCLQHFQYDVDPVTKQRSKKPKHNWASHGAKSFMYYCIQLREGFAKEREEETGGIEQDRFVEAQSQGLGWME